MSVSIRWGRNFVFVALVAVTAAANAAPTASPESSASRLVAQLEREGAARMLAELDRRPELFDAVLTGVESADPAWLQLARGLRGGADGADAEQLDMAIARALPNDPSRVLALVGHGIDLQRICTSPFIEPAAGVAEAYESRTLAALAEVRAPALRPLATACARRVKLPTT